ncbi:MAG: LptE family protein [Flavobacteriales bacterium]|nr:LptE family protein [Flavobacteriales bacterium]
MIKLAGILICLVAISGCSARYSFTGGQFSGAKTFSVEYFKPQTALASQVYAQRFTETLKEQLLSQSPLQLAESGGELSYKGSVTDYRITPVATQANETAALNRLTITIKVKYTNTLESDLSFDKTFSRFADFEASQDLFSVEEPLWSEINDQLAQDVYNASVGNW